MNTFLFLIFAFSGSFGSENLITTNDLGDPINFTLVNRSNEDVTLKFPGQSNKVLAARVQTKVSLSEGAKIFFFVKKKKYLLMSVKEEIAGKNVIVDELIKKRRKELGV